MSNIGSSIRRRSGRRVESSMGSSIGRCIRSIYRVYRE